MTVMDISALLFDYATGIEFVAFENATFEIITNCTGRQPARSISLVSSSGIIVPGQL